MTECTICYSHSVFEEDGDIFTEDIELSLESYREKVKEIAEMLQNSDDDEDDDAEEVLSNALANGEEDDGETLNVYKDFDVEIYEGAHATWKAAEKDGQLLYRLSKDRDFLKANGIG